ncbi:MAG: 3-phosphoshikimate 1-carboxyvinyltransferase [Bacteroidota bacterium]
MLRIPEILLPEVKGTVQLPSSKSISHRLMIIRALAPQPIELINLSDSNDTVLLSKALLHTNDTVNFEDAGTPMRFFLAYAALKNLPVTITGTDKLQQRPIAPLINALRQLGAVIESIGGNDQLPLRIVKGVDLNATTVTIDSGMSSQFISALLLIAPCFTNGLTIVQEGAMNSEPYITMTITAMQQCGVKVKIVNNVYHIENGNYQFTQPIVVESDWSAATFLYAIASVAKNADIFLPHLKFPSIQGDSAAVVLFSKLGVNSTWDKDGIRIQSNDTCVTELEVDFTNIPDMFPAVIAVCVFKGIPLRCKGIANLPHKESNRIAAMQENLIQVGAQFQTISDNELLVKVGNTQTGTYTFKSFSDHRIIMACSIFAFKHTITIDDETHVKKSFPAYWECLQQLGIIIEK